MKGKRRWDFRRLVRPCSVTTTELYDVLSVAELAAHFGASRHLIRLRFRTGDLHALRFGKGWYVPRAWLVSEQSKAG